MPRSSHWWSDLSLITPEGRIERFKGSEMRIKRNLEPGKVIQPELWVTPGQTTKRAIKRGEWVLKSRGGCKHIGKGAVGVLKMKVFCLTWMWSEYSLCCLESSTASQPYHSPDLTTHVSHTSTRKILLKRSRWILCAVYIFVPHLISLAIISRSCAYLTA